MVFDFSEVWIYVNFSSITKSEWATCASPILAERNLLCARQKNSKQRHFQIKMEVCLSGCVFSSLVYELENSRGDVVRFNLWEFLLFDLLILTILSPVISGRIVVGSDIKTYSKHHYRFSVWKFAAWAGCKWVFKIAVVSLNLKSWRASLWCSVFIFIAIQGFVPLDKSRRYVYIVVLF